MSARPASDLGRVVALDYGVTLRLKHRDDAPNDYAWARDPDLARLNHRPVSEEVYWHYLARLEQELRFVNPRERTFAIEDANGVHIGNIMYYNAAATGDSAEIGITIGSPLHRGAGAGRRAIVLFLRYLFETTSFRRVALRTLEGNEPAFRCFRACGFEEIRRTEHGGPLLVEMAVRREYWLLQDSQGRFAPHDSGIGVHAKDTEMSPATSTVTA